MTIDHIYLALCLMLVIEGLAYGLFPTQMKRMMAQIFALPNQTLQNAGLALAVTGCLLIWVIG